MLDLNDLRIFIAIADHRGILRAARALDLPKSTVSRRLAALEEQAKGRLVIRSNDQFQLTPLGEELQLAGQRMVEAAQGAEDLVERGLARIHGPVTLNAAPLFRDLMARHWPQLARAHPDLRLALDVSDRSGDPGEAFDLCLSAACWPLRDSSYIQRRLCRNPMVLVDLPGRAERPLGPPAALNTAAARDLLAFAPDLAARPATFRRLGGAEQQLMLTPKLASTDCDLLRRMVLADAGMALLPEYAVRDDLRAGRLQLVCPGWIGPEVTLALLSPSRRLMNARLRRLADELGQCVKQEVLQGLDAKGVPRMEQAVPPPAAADVTKLSSALPSQPVPGASLPSPPAGPEHAESEMDMNPFYKAFGIAALTAAAGLPAAAQDESGPLVLYTNDFEGLITERFEADTGRQIDVVQMSGGELLARIAAEASNPQWDALIFNGSYSFEALDQQGQLKRDVAPENLGNLNEIGETYLPESQGWFPISLTASCVMMYRTDLVEQPPVSFDDLADPRFRDQVGMADPAVAAPAYPCVSSFFHQMGDEGAEALFSDLFDNGLRVFRTNGPVRRAVASGEISVGLITSQQGYTLKAAGDPPVEVVWPEDGAPGSVRGVGIQAETARPEAARAFVDWLLTAETQTYLQDTGGSDGLFTGTVTGTSGRADGPDADVVYNVTPDAFAVENEARIKSWFADRALN